MTLSSLAEWGTVLIYLRNITSTSMDAQTEWGRRGLSWPSWFEPVTVGRVKTWGRRCACMFVCGGWVEGLGGGWRGYNDRGKDWDWQDKGEKDGEAVKASKTNRDRRLVMQKKRRKRKLARGTVGHGGCYVPCFAWSSLHIPRGQTPGARHLVLFQVVKA